jgi:hypothetical protein
MRELAHLAGLFRGIPLTLREFVKVFTSELRYGYVA